MALVVVVVPTATPVLPGERSSAVAVVQLLVELEVL